MKASTKRKLSLATTICLSLFTVISASVVSFAWFQANANATISATSSSTNITVNKPDSYVYYAYAGNGDSSYVPEDAGNDFSDDFITLNTPELVATYTNFDEMSPGDVYVFAVQVKAASSVSLVLNEIVSNNSIKQGDVAAAGTPLAADAPGADGVTYATRAAKGVGDTPGYLVNDSYKFTKVNSIPAEHAANVYYPLTNLGCKRYNKDYDCDVNIGYAMDIFVNAITPDNDDYPTGYSTFVTSDSGCTGTAVAGTALANGATAEKGVKYYTRSATSGVAGPYDDGENYQYTYYGTGPFTADAANTYYPLTSQAEDVFNFNAATSADRTLLDSGSYASQTIDLSDSDADITFFDDDGLDTSEDLYIFWSVVFSDVEELRYIEVKSGDNTPQKEEPTEGNRYFKQDDNGNSNCFGGLDFALSSFTLTIG